VGEVLLAVAAHTSGAGEMQKSGNKLELAMNEIDIRRRRNGCYKCEAYSEKVSGLRMVSHCERYGAARKKHPTWPEILALCANEREATVNVEIIDDKRDAAG
jgi:hypothetical protein